MNDLRLNIPIIDRIHQVRIMIVRQGGLTDPLWNINTIPQNEELLLDSGVK